MIPADDGNASHVLRLAPVPGPVAVAELLAALTQPPALPPFAPETLAFLIALRRRLIESPAARLQPDLQARAFWLRPAALAQLAKRFQAGVPGGTLAVPRGLVLHVPPANVDTMFVYSWVPALLTGNRNLIRLSERTPGPAALILLDSLSALLATPEAASVAAATALIRYPRDEAITAAFSKAADVRMLWGGDTTVTTLRALPTAPHTLDLTFPDRTSWAAIAAESYLALASEQRHRLAEAFCNDLFWFDQQACASPRLLFWCGEEQKVAAAAADLHPRLAACAALGFPEPGPAARLERLAAWHRAALDLPVEHIAHHGERLTVIRLASSAVSMMSSDALITTGTGIGLLLEARLDRLTDSLPWVTRRVQTLAHFGFAPQTLADFAQALNGRGIDRLAPLGQALTFAAIWDGTDLPRALTRLVTLTP